jgi:hypothetical protein
MATDMEIQRIIFCQRELVHGKEARHEVAHQLGGMGYKVLQTDDGPLDLCETDLIWIQGNANWYPRICRQLENAAARPMSLIWHTEPLPPGPDSGLPRPPLSVREIAKILLRDRRATDPYTNARRLLRLKAAGVPDLLVASSRGRQAFAASRGIECEFVPMGYSQKVHGRDLGLDRDIDVLFLGQMVRRRRTLARQIAKAGVTLRSEGSWFDPATWGENRTQMLNRTKILLNLSRFRGEFAGLRLILGMCNGALVVSEPIYRPQPFVAGEHYIEATPAQMPGVIGHYLNHPEERQRIADKARHFVTHELTLERSLQYILRMVDTKWKARIDTLHREPKTNAHSAVQTGHLPGSD